MSNGFKGRDPTISVRPAKTFDPPIVSNDWDPRGQ